MLPLLVCGPYFQEQASYRARLLSSCSISSLKQGLPEAQGLRNRKVNHVWLGGEDLTYENLGTLLTFNLSTN